MSLQGALEAPESGTFELRRLRLLPRSGTSQSRAGMLALTGILLSGLLIAVSAAQTDSLLPESVRPLPSSLAGPFGLTGLNLHVAGAVGVLALMFASYVVAVRAADRLSGRMVVICIAALHALILLAPPLFSTDLFSYQAYARMGALYGANPYLLGPHAIALDPVYSFIGARWVTIPTVYGPVFTTLSYLLAPLSIAASVVAYKATAAVASLATVALVWHAAKLRGVNPVRAAALVGLNPLLVVYGVGGGHNDLLMLAAMTGGVLLLLQRRERAGAWSIVVAGGVKVTAWLLLPFSIAQARGRANRSRRRDLWIGAAVAAALLAAVGGAAFGTGPLHLPSTVVTSQSQGDWHSIPGFISTRLGLGTIGHITGLVLAAVFAAVTCWLVRRVWRGELDWIDGAGWAVTVMLVTASALLPWYLAMLMPLAALASDRRLLPVALVITGVVQGIEVLGYIPHAISVLGI